MGPRIDDHDTEAMRQVRSGSTARLSKVTGARKSHKIQCATAMFYYIYQFLDLMNVDRGIVHGNDPIPLEALQMNVQRLARNPDG